MTKKWKYYVLHKHSPNNIEVKGGCNLPEEALTIPGNWLCIRASKTIDEDEVLINGVYRKVADREFLYRGQFDDYQYTEMSWRWLDGTITTMGVIGRPNYWAGRLFGNYSSLYNPPVRPDIVYKGQWTGPRKDEHIIYASPRYEWMDNTAQFITREND
jgi:hypothetical protein